MKKKIVSLLLTGVMAAGMLAGCGGQSIADQQAASSSGSASDSAEGGDAEGSTEESGATMAAADEVDGTEITFWHSMGGVNGQAIDELVKRFNEENDLGITVVSEYQGEYDDALNKLRSAQIGNMGADLVQVYEIGTRFMIDSGWIVPMQEMIDQDNYDISQIEPNLAAYYTVDDQLYSMPFNSSTPLMYYNKDIFDKAGITEIPTSLEGIEAIGDQLLNEGAQVRLCLFLSTDGSLRSSLENRVLITQNNGNGREEAATAVAFDENGGAKNILTAWKSLSDKGYAPIVGRGGDAGLADFSSGQAAITLASTASLKQILQDVNGKFEVGTAYFPSIKDSDEGGVSIGGASLWALNNNDPKKLRATWEFVKFMISPESQAYWNAQTGYFPVTVAAQEEQVFKDNIAQYPQFQTAIDQLHDSSPEYVGALLSVFSEARDTVESEIESMLNGEVDVDEAVSNMADTINKSIEEYNLVNG